MLKNTHIWLGDYYSQRSKRAALKSYKGVRHILFCIADHFEPRNGGVSTEQEISRVNKWLSLYRPLTAQHHDSTGKPPRYTFFYPIDEYTHPCIDLVANFCREGYGEVEIHLHHDGDTKETLALKLFQGIAEYEKHGLLSTDKKNNETRYGFIHGNWALDNSRPDRRWCGVNKELTVLKETGCYADFTLPSAPSDTQTKKINSIYYAVDTPQPKSHNTGIDVTVGKKPSGDLMLVQGPLMLNWQNRKFGILPRIENAALTSGGQINADRVRLWIDAGVIVQGRPEWVFVKIHNHGLRDDHLTDNFFQKLDRLFSILETEFNDGKRFQLHYVTAREMYNIAKAAEAGKSGDPGHYRDYELISRLKTETIK